MFRLMIHSIFYNTMMRSQVVQLKQLPKYLYLIHTAHFKSGDRHSPLGMSWLDLAELNVRIQVHITVYKIKYYLARSFLQVQ